MNPKVDAYFNRAEKWREESKTLRAIIVGCPLTEELKWGKPCYSFEGSNVVIVQGFKESCALLFCKGALLKDPQGILEKPGENTQGAKRIRFTSVGEIVKMKAVLKAYVKEAIEVEKAGLEVSYKTTAEFVMPEEFRTKLEGNRALKKAFEGLTPGRQRAYLLHFSGAKQSKTREARVERCMERILSGKGLDDL